MTSPRRAPGRPLAIGLIAALAISILPGSPIQSARAISPNIVISEVYGGGGNAGATYTNDFIQLFNRGTTAIVVDGWSVQYASSAGTSWQRTNLTGSIAPGQAYLIQEAQGAGGTTPLPAPDASGTILMSATAAKVALLNINTTIASGTSCPSGATVVDLVGYGNATNCFEGSPIANLSNTTAAARTDNCVDTDNNSADFTIGAPVPENSASPLDPCTSGDAAPSVASSVPADGASGISPATSLQVTFSEPVAVAGEWFSIACAASGAHAATVSGGPTTFALDPTADFGPVEVCTVTIVSSQVTDLDSDDPPDNPTEDSSFSFTTMAACGATATPIHDVQGSGAASPLVGQQVEVEGVVVGDFQPSSSFNGFHIQDEDVAADADPATSEGIFVFEGGNAVAVAPGDTVRVAGGVVEFLQSGATLTQLSAVTGVLVCSSGTTVTPEHVALPFADLAFAERFEGMLVETTQDLTVSETFSLGRFGEVLLSSGGRLINPTNVVEPGAPAIALQSANNLNRIVLDDGDGTQNLDPTLYPAGGLSAANTLRVGDTVQAGQFVLEQRFGVYRLQPIEAVEIGATNPRPEAPAQVGGGLKIAALNVLNFFTTLDAQDGGCGPTGVLDCRGANTIAELNRQRAKTVAEIVGLDADILGLMEIQNDDGTTTADLVAAVNADPATISPYAYINTSTIGTDAIKLALLYRPAVVTPVGAHKILTSAIDPDFIDNLNRPALAQTFDDANGGRLTVVVNHLKSKGSDCNAVGDPDAGDGQGNCNGVRTAAAGALVDWIATDPTGSGDRDVLVIGDLNSYAKEDPIDVFVNAGYTNLIDAFLGDEGYSFVFQGQSGYLDHALASPTLAAQVTGVTEWHVNADEPTVLDYNVEFKSANQINTLYAATPYRSSDHDPVVVGLNLLNYGFRGFLRPVDNPPAVNRVKAGVPVPMSFLLRRGLGRGVLFETPTSATFDCSTGTPTGQPEPTTTLGNIGLIHIPPIGFYSYPWRTQRAWAQTCRTFTLTLDDGTYRSAAFEFRR